MRIEIAIVFALAGCQTTQSDSRDVVPEPEPDPAPDWTTDAGLEGAPFRLDSPACSTSADRVFCTDVVYSEVGATKLRLDLYAPLAARTKRVPAIIYLHGGGWSRGTYHDPG